MYKILSILIFCFLLFSCSSDEWDENNRNEFIEKCSENLSEETCKCVIEKIETKYKPSDLAKDGDEEVIQSIREASKECMGL